MSYIRVHGANQNNLKNVSVDIPKHQLTVFTGRSGSGKSSLVFNVLAAESERLLNETYSSYIQHQLTQYEKPDAQFTIYIHPFAYYGRASAHLLSVIPMFFHLITRAACANAVRVWVMSKISI